MEWNKRKRNGTEKNRLKHGNGTFEHGTIKKKELKKFFDLFSANMRKRNVPHGIIF